jgi:nucleotide-binding universal stress UspA family protein
MTNKSQNGVQYPSQASRAGPVPCRGRILVGVDGSPASVTALRWARAEALLREMRLHIVWVRDCHAAAPGHYAPLGASPGAAECARPESTFKDLVDEALGPAGGLMAQLELADGLPARELLNRTSGAAMLVLGNTRSGGLDVARAGKPSIPLGPVARECLRAALCPVVIVTSPVRSPEGELARPQPIGGGGVP